MQFNMKMYVITIDCSHLLYIKSAICWYEHRACIRKKTAYSETSICMNEETERHIRDSLVFLHIKFTRKQASSKNRSAAWAIECEACGIWVRLSPCDAESFVLCGFKILTFTSLKCAHNFTTDTHIHIRVTHTHASHTHIALGSHMMMVVVVVGDEEILIQN